MNDERTYDCPLCGTDFTGAQCRSACPLASGCKMVRCPRCGYEFVESGRFVDMLLRWIRRAPECARQPRPVDAQPITDLPVGSTARIASIAQTSAARLNRLASYGIVPGTEVRLVSRRPAVVLECGSASVAVEDEIGRQILVVTPPPAQ